MRFDSQTLKHLQKLDRPEFDFLFQQMDTTPSVLEQKLLDELAEIACQELGLPEQELEKVTFFIRLGYFCHEEQVQNREGLPEIIPNQEGKY